VGNKTFIGVRDVDEETFRKFKAVAMRRNLNLGIALSLAMQKWLEQKRKNKPDPKNFLNMNPIDFGPGNERLSSDIDEILYGLKK